jgi:hypothetical protein
VSAKKDLLRAKAAAAGAINRVSPVEPHPRVKPRVREGSAAIDLKAKDRAERDAMRHVLAKLDAGFWDWDIPTSQIWYSDYILKLAGYDPADVTGAENFYQNGVHPDASSAN